MDKLTRYRQLIKDTLTAHLELAKRFPKPGIESLLIADEARGHYQLFDLGWAEHKRVRNLQVYVRLRNGKIWIEHDMTEDSIATELLAAGVPETDIVLAFHAPELRQYTEFAAA